MRLIALVFALCVTGALAACPNQCSGHGRCSAFDRCECFRQAGTTWRQRVGWTSPDCSQRTCPLGVAFDFLSTDDEDAKLGPILFETGRKFDGTKQTVGDSVLRVHVRDYQLSETQDFQIRVTTAVADETNDPPTFPESELKIQWKLRKHETFSREFDALRCTLHRPCELQNNGMEKTGVYVYWQTGTDTSDSGNDDVPKLIAEQNNIAQGNRYEFNIQWLDNTVYRPNDPNSAHQHVECSGRGTCNRGSGRCSCFASFTGEACQRTICPSDCSGHGVCQDLRRFANDANEAASEAGAGLTIAYKNAYDSRKQFGCACDAGFRGPDCSQIECPSGKDPMGGYGADGRNSQVELTEDPNGPAMDCSGRGICDFSSGICQCFKGYFGERCEQQTNFV